MHFWSKKRQDFAPISPICLPCVHFKFTFSRPYFISLHCFPCHLYPFGLFAFAFGIEMLSVSVSKSRRKAHENFVKSAPLLAYNRSVLFNRNIAQPNGRSRHRPRQEFDIKPVGGFHAPRSLAILAKNMTEPVSR